MGWLEALLLKRMDIMIIADFMALMPISIKCSSDV
jgi:hypothetical protein